jgi:AmmeMemoRadiSam system protein A
MSQLTPEEASELFDIAWQALRVHVLCNGCYEGEPCHPVLREPRAAFVTLKTKGSLRGCIGRLYPLDPLYRTVADCAVAAASRDYRFDSVTVEELPDIELEISVLGPMEPIEDVGQIEVGTHGLYIEKDSYKGLLLPQVAVEHNLNRERFLELTCRKAGLPLDAWKQGATIQIFSAQIIQAGAP